MSDKTEWRPVMQALLDAYHEDKGDPRMFHNAAKDARDLLAAAPTPPAQEAHPDDAALDRLAGVLKAKLADARAKGRSGWQDPAWTTPDEDLNALLTLTGSQLGEADVALAGLDALERVFSKLAPQESQPVAWIRFCSNGAIEGPLLDSQIEDVRRKSGAWTPLIAAPIPAQQEPKK